MTGPAPAPRGAAHRRLCRRRVEAAGRQPRHQALVQRGRVRRAARRRRGLRARGARSCTATPTAARPNCGARSARRFGLDPERIVCGTGSDELIQHLCHIYGGPGTEIIMSMHGFTMYQIAGTYAGSRVLKTPERNLTADVDAMLARGVGGDAGGVPRQPQQPHRQPAAARRGGAAAARPAARRAAGARCRLCRICRARRLRPRRRSWSMPATTR